MTSRNHLFLFVFGIASAALTACSSDSSDNGTDTGGTSNGGTSNGGTSNGGTSNGGTSGNAGTSTGGTTGSVPADSTQASLAAFLQAESYKQAPWISQTAAPRDASSPVSPHGKVQVWMNDTLVASQHAGNGELDGTAHTTGSMAVKEFYDDANARVGRAAMLKVNGAAEAWVFYCDSTDTARCGVSETLPYYGDSTAECNGCHGGLIYTHAP